MNDQLKKLQEIFKEKGLKSLNNFDSYVSTNSNIDYICQNGHKGKSKAKNFLYNGTGCSLCAVEKRKRVLSVELDELGLKVCNLCKKDKVKSHFGKLKSQVDGLRATCKLCRRKGHIILMEDNGDAMKDIRNTASRKYLKLHPFRFLTSRCKSNHNKKGFIEDFCISEDYLKALFKKQDGLCYWSNMPLDIENVGRNKLDNVSVDRLDCSKGYIEGNVVLTTKFINLGRGNNTQEEFTLFLANLKAVWTTTHTPLK